ncbi:MAG: glycosyltransferase family 2 protein [Solirubrobacteraceae bacterium]
MSAARVTALVLTYDGRELLEEILPSLAAQEFRPFRTIVVDNGSSDGTAAWVREARPGCEVLRLEENVGVAAALNRGLALVHTEYVALLNNDLELEAGWLGALVAALDAHPRAASATGKMLSFHERGVFDAAGDLLHWSGAATHRGMGQPDMGQYDTPEAVFAPCAGAALYRRAAFDAVGPFDEAFFAYQEDVDWGLRAQLAGWTARYEPRAVAYHMGGATTRRTWGYYNALQRRNQVLVVLKDYPGRALARHSVKIALYQAGWVVASAKEGNLRRQLSALGEVAVALPRVVRQRREVQALRRVRIAYLDTVITPEPYAGQSPLQRLRSILGTLLSR